MPQILIFLIGVVAGVILTLVLVKRSEKEKKESLIKKQAREKEANKEAILGILETQHPLTNNHVEQLLGISDATATRYFEELEKEGRVRQVGAAGRGAYYELAEPKNLPTAGR